jgi:hypothetical protein
LTKHHNWPVI